jgi:hypothetical protein
MEPDAYATGPSRTRAYFCGVAAVFADAAVPLDFLFDFLLLPFLAVFAVLFELFAVLFELVLGCELAGVVDCANIVVAVASSAVNIRRFMVSFSLVRGAFLPPTLLCSRRFAPAPITCARYGRGLLFARGGE